MTVLLLGDSTALNRFCGVTKEQTSLLLSDERFLNCTKVPVPQNSCSSVFVSTALDDNGVLKAASQWKVKQEFDLIVVVLKASSNRCLLGDPIFRPVFVWANNHFTSRESKPNVGVLLVRDEGMTKDNSLIINLVSSDANLQALNKNGRIRVWSPLQTHDKLSEEALQELLSFNKLTVPPCGGRKSKTERKGTDQFIKGFMVCSLIVLLVLFGIAYNEGFQSLFVRLLPKCQHLHSGVMQLKEENQRLWNREQELLKENNLLKSENNKLDELKKNITEKNKENEELNKRLQSQGKRLTSLCKRFCPPEVSTDIEESCCFCHDRA